MDAQDFLRTASDTMDQRAKDRDQDRERSMEKIVDMFNVLHGTNLTESQGWSFMVLLKMVRANVGGNFRADDYIDQIAYTGLEAESRS